MLRPSAATAATVTVHDCGSCTAVPMHGPVEPSAAVGSSGASRSTGRRSHIDLGPSHSGKVAVKFASPGCGSAYGEEPGGPGTEPSRSTSTVAWACETLNETLSTASPAGPNGGRV